MPVFRTYECPDCRGTFEHFHMRRDEPAPDECPLCGGVTSDVQPELSAPHLAKSIGAVADKVYRDMESGSIARAEMAAEQTGEDMTAMRMTNLRDDARAGDASASRVSNDVSRLMAANPGVGGLQQSAAVSSYIQGGKTGQYSGMGEVARQGVVSRHRETAARVAAAGNVGTYRAS